MTIRRYAPLKQSRGTVIPTEQNHCHVCGVKITPEATACVRHHHALHRKPRERACAVCERRFTPYPSAMARSAAKFCSVECYRIDVGKRVAFLHRVCPQCGSSFRRTRAATARVKESYCSLKCATTAHSGPGSASWRGGADPNRGQGWLKLAEQIRERDGRRCRRCGKTEEGNGQKLSVDHIQPWRSFESDEEANAPSNLAALCRPCHARKGRAERLWLQGDVLDMWRYQVAVAEPWTKG